jgi:ribulose-phosphate 3-epimerase
MSAVSANLTSQSDMPVICPTVTAFDPHEYRAQIERLVPFAKRIHIDLMDGEFAPTKSPDLDQIWLPEEVVSDIHLMYQRPADYLEQLITLKPSLVVIHYEANVDHVDFAAKLKAAGIKAGLALLQETAVDEAADMLPKFDHVMVYSGHLGEHGGEADLSLLEKVRQIRNNFPDIEISWDGGINDQNAKQLVEAGVDVLNVGGFIQQTDDPAKQYSKIQRLVL